jgi:RHS repeat-associated protein
MPKPASGLCNRAYAQVVRETNATTGNITDYLYGDDLIKQTKAANDSYYLYDGLGSTRALTNSAGSVTDTYNYESFGTVLNQTGTTPNNYLFTGEQFDNSLNNYYLRARYYDQSIGRFTQMDTWMGNNSDPMTLHKYLYANANPVNNVDPTGNFSIGSVMATVNVVATLASVSQTSYDFFSDPTQSLSGDASSFAVEGGMFALTSMGGFKIFKLIGKKFLKKLGCEKANSKKKICDIFKPAGQRIKKIKKAIGAKKRQNVAYADYITSSGIGTMIANSGKKNRPGTVGMPSSRRYITSVVGFSRAFDSEVKLYENLAINFNPNTKGIVNLVSERPICASCGGVGSQFKMDFKGVFVMSRGGF